MIQNVGILLLGCAMTILVSTFGNALGLALGMAVCLLRLSPSLPVRWLGGVYVSVFRGVPLLVQLLIVYYFLPIIGLDLPPLVAAVLGLGLCSAAYQAENLRGGFTVVPRGHIEAAHAFGYNGWQTRRHIVIPEALRAAAPALVNEIILITKASSLVSVVGVLDLMRASQNIVARDLQPMLWYLTAGAFYLAISLLLAQFGRAAERRLGVGHVKSAI
jgi:polar amino acid transport system permease protein